MKIICKIHPLTYLFILVFILLGYFHFYFSFLIIIIVHELGHLCFALIFKWHIKEVIFLPMGALIKFEDNLNKPIIEEFIIAIMGIIFQTIFIYFFRNELFVVCYKIILFFNILPIYPLDGAKVINLFLNKITSFRNSYKISLLISYFGVIILISIAIIKLSLFSFLAFFPLLINVISLVNKRREVYMKFLLERYLYNIHFKKYKYIENIYQMKRDYKHYFLINLKIVDEKYFLNQMFEEKLHI